MGYWLGGKALGDVVNTAKPNTILGWYRKLVVRLFRWFMRWLYTLYLLGTWSVRKHKPADQCFDALRAPKEMKQSIGALTSH
jgi:hypothetical protein